MSFLFRGMTRKPGEKVRMDGTPIPGAWAYGGVFEGPGAFSIIYGHKDGEPEDTIKKYSVYTDTLGLWTGAKDKNGKLIFPGDVLYDGKMYFIVGYSRFLISCFSRGHSVYGYGFCFSSVRDPEMYPLDWTTYENPRYWHGIDPILELPNLGEVSGTVWTLPEFAKWPPQNRRTGGK